MFSFISNPCIKLQLPISPTNHQSSQRFGPLRLWKFVARHSNSVREAVLGTQAWSQGAITNGCLTGFNRTYLETHIYIYIYVYTYIWSFKQMLSLVRFLLVGCEICCDLSPQTIVFSSSLPFWFKITESLASAGPCAVSACVDPDLWQLIEV